MIVSAKQFWSKGFLFCCFIPLAVLTALHIASGNYWGAAWQTATLILLCANNYLLCANQILKNELFEQLQLNIDLLELTKKTVQEKDETK